MCPVGLTTTALGGRRRDLGGWTNCACEEGSGQNGHEE
jgi:hypothetical protein